MKPPRKNQKELIFSLQKLLDLAPYKSGMNTHQIADYFGHHQKYESFLRNRLIRLENLGFLKRKEETKNGTVTERIWKFTHSGWKWYPDQKVEFPLTD